MCKLLFPNGLVAWNLTGARFEGVRFGNPKELNPPSFVQIPATVNKEDASIIERVLKGETAAFEALVRLYQARLFNSLIQALGCPEEAEDVAQEAFVKAYSKLATFKQNSSEH